MELEKKFWGISFGQRTFKDDRYLNILEDTILRLRTVGLQRFLDEVRSLGLERAWIVTSVKIKKGEHACTTEEYKNGTKSKGVFITWHGWAIEPVQDLEVPHGMIEIRADMLNFCDVTNMS